MTRIDDEPRVLRFTCTDTAATATVPPAAIQSWHGYARGNNSWVLGRLGQGGSQGPLALRAEQDTLAVRVLVDGSVIEAYWDGGRARYTSRAYPPPRSVAEVGLKVAASDGRVTADVIVYEMGSAWLDPVELPADFR